MNSYKDQKISTETIIDSHFLAVSANVELCKKFGINEKNVFPIWDQIGGRFSVSSAVGALPISIAFGFEVFKKFLMGLEKADSLFFKEDSIKKNIPVLLALLDSFHNFT